MLAGTRRATSTEHIVQLERLASTPGIRPQARAFLNYAAGKEYEDLEQWPDAFAAFEEQGVFDAGVSRRFLTSILEQGGSRDAMDAFVEFRGRKPQIEPLLKQLGLAA